MDDLVELSKDEMDALVAIAQKDGISWREALSQAIHILASKVDYTDNVSANPSAA